jgi:hypothetical protein
LIGLNQIPLPNNFFDQSSFDRYVAFLKSTSLSDASLKRKLSSLSSFQKFLVKKNLVNPPAVSSIIPDTTPTKKNLFLSLFHFPKKIRTGFIRSPQISQTNNNNSKLRTYLIIVSLLIISAGIGYTLYTQIIQRARTNYAYTTASSPVYANRFLSFQGRLTDTSGNPIISSTNIRFELYDTEAVGTGTSLYSSGSGNSQTVIPDDNGIFSVTIGKTHGTQIPNSVFTQNPAVYLQIIAGGETMSPRQPIATVAYAINSESLQGLPPSASGYKNTVMVIDSSGNLNLGETSPTIKATSGTLGIEGQAVLIDATNGLDNSNIRIDPVNPNGAIQLNTTGTGSSNSIVASNANLTTGNLFYGKIGNTNRGYNFLNFSNFNTGTTQLSTRFSVDAYGNTFVGGTLSSTNISIGNTLLTASAANLNLLTGLNSTSGSVIYANGSNLVNTSVGTSGQLLMSNGSGTPTWMDPSGIGTTYSASNGLSLVGHTFQLGGLLSQNTDINLSGFNLTFSDAGSTLVSFSNTGNTFYNPTSFTSSGDVSMAYDLNFTNSSGSNINTAGPLSINTGEVFNSSNLTLQTYNAGKIILSSSNLWADGTYVGIGTTNPTHTLDVIGDGSFSGNLTVGGTFVSVGSTSLVTNLNADFLDGYNFNNLPYVNNVTDTTLTRSGTGPFTLGLNLNNANIWTATQTFTNGIGVSATANFTNNINVGGTAIFNSYVGIGTTNPISPLDIASGITTNQNLIHGTGTINDYLQLNIQNLSSGTSASSDLVATANNGTETSNYIDMGINGSGYTNAVVGNADDAYLYSTGNNLLVGNATAGKDVVFFTNGTNAYVNERMRITSTGRIGIGTSNPGFLLDVNGNANIGATLTVAGSESVTSNLSVGKTLTAGSMAITGNGSIGGTLSVTGSASISNNLSVGKTLTAGSMAVTGNASVGGTLSVTGRAVLSAGFTANTTSFVTSLGIGNSLAVTGNASVGGTLSVTSNASIGKTLSAGSMAITGNGSIGGTLSVTGRSVLGAGFTANATSFVTSLGIGNSLAVVGNASVGGTLSVTSNLSVGKTLTAGSMAITGNASVGGTLSITGSESITKNLSVGGTFTLTNGAQNNYVLTSDASGNARWAPASGNATATNGLSIIGSSIGLGGTLTQNTQIGTSSFSLSFLGLGNVQSLYLNPSGNVGIGTTGPSAKLTVVNGISDGYSFLYGIDDTYPQNRPRVGIGTTNWNGVIDLFNSGDSLATKINTNGPSFFNGGNVGIGTTNPHSELSVIGNNNWQLSLDAGVYPEIGRLAYESDGSGYGFGIGQKDLSGNNYVDYMYFKDGGNVGIGTTNPLHTLDIVGDANISTNFTVGGTFISVGTTSLVTNLNADLLDGYHAGNFISIGQTGSLPYVTGATDSTLTRSGSGPYTLGLNLGNSNTWTANQAFSNSGVSLNTTSAFNGSIIAQATPGSRSTTVGAQLEFVIPANTDGSNLWGQARIITVAGNTNNSDATGKMILGTRRMINKLGSGSSWYYGDDLTIDGNGEVGIGTTNPLYKLDVNGSANIGQTLTTTTLAVTANGTIGGTLAVTGSGWVANNWAVGGILSSVGRAQFTNGFNVVSNGVGISGNSTFSNNLNVGGTAIFNSLVGIVGVGVTTSSPLDIGITRSNIVGSATISDVSSNMVGSVVANAFYDKSDGNYFLNSAGSGSNNVSLSLTSSGSTKFNVKDGVNQYIISDAAARIQNFSNGLSLDTGTAGSIGAGNAIAWNTQLFLSINGKVGVGTSSPDVKFHIDNQSLTGLGDTAVYDVFKLSNTNSGNPTVPKGSNFTIALSRWQNTGNNYPRTRVDFKTTGLTTDNNSTPNTIMSLRDDGNVGIGNTNPAVQLQISYSSAVNTLQDELYLDNSRAYGTGAGNFGSALAFTTSEGGGNAAGRVLGRIGASVQSEGDSSNGNLVFQTRTGGTPTEKMRISYNGYVGIGNVNPSQLLTVGSPGSAGSSFYNIGANTMGVNSSLYSYGYICAGNSNGGCDGSGGVVMGPSNNNADISLGTNGDMWFNHGTNRIAFSTDNSTDGTPNVALHAVTNDLWVENWNGSSYVNGMRIGPGSSYVYGTLDTSGGTYDQGSRVAISRGEGRDYVQHTYSLLINGATWNSVWNWSGQGGQPTWLWGSNDGTNMYVWNPSNFSVNYASSANSATYASQASGNAFRVGNFVISNAMNQELDFDAYGQRIAFDVSGGRPFWASNAPNWTASGGWFSDSRLKTNIIDMNSSVNDLGVASVDIGSTGIVDIGSSNSFVNLDSLDVINSLNPVTFNWNSEYQVYLKAKSDEMAQRQFGFIAQDVEKIMPSLVMTDPKTGYKSLDYRGMIPLAISAIQKIDTKVVGLNKDLSLTSTGQISVNYNVSDDVLASLGYDGAKNEIENATYSLSDSLGLAVTRISQFGQIISAKVQTGLLAATNVISQNIITKNLISQKITTDNIISPLGNIDHLTTQDIQTSQITADNVVAQNVQATQVAADNITATDASISGTLYADNIISKEGSFGDLMTAKISSLRDEVKSIVAARTATESALLAESHDWMTSIASDSAKIDGDLALSDNLIVGAKLMVNGDTQLGNAFISGIFTAGEVAIKDNIMETTATALYIQPSGSGSVDIMNGTLVVAENGDVQINGNLTVHGSLFASLLKADEITTNKLTATDSNLSDIQSNKINIATDSASTVIASDNQINLATNSAQLNSNATAGTTTLPTGKTELVIHTDKLTANSMVYLTPVGSTQNQVVYVKNKVTDGSGNYFTIAIDQPLTQDIQVNWWIIN